jgi:signal transduction histidine kinase
MYHKKYLLLLTVLFVFAISYSQQKIIDSLKTILTQNPIDSVKVKTYGDLCWYYRNVSTDSAFVYGDYALKLSKETGSLKGEAQAYNDIGIIHYGIAEYKKSLKSYNYSLKIRKDLKDTLGIAALYNKMGLCHQNMFKMDSAIYYATKALKIYEDKKNVRYANFIKTNIANIYKGLKQYDKALKSHLEIAEVCIEIGDNKALTRSYNNIANAYLFLNDTLQSVNYYKKGIEIAEKNNYERELSAMYNNYGGVLSDLGENTEAIAMVKKSLNLRQKLNDNYGVASTSLSLGTLYMEDGNLKPVEDYLRFGLKLSIESNANELKMDAYDKLSSYYAFRKNPDSVIYYKELFKNIKDSIFSSRVTKEVAEVQEKYDTAEREKEILTQRADLAEQELDLSKKNYYILGLGALAVVLSLIGYLFYNQQRLKNRQLQKENELKDALVKIETQNRLQDQRLRISRDLHDNIGAQLTFIISSLDNLKYGFKIPEKLGSKLKHISQFTTTTIYELRDTIWAMNKSEITFEDLQTRISNFIDKAESASDKTQFNFTVDDDLYKEKAFTSVDGMNIYRIIQEAINNALKYAEAKMIDVNIKKIKNNIEFSIVDNGKGFDIHTVEKGNGLTNMKKRTDDIKGELKIISSSNNGTQISITI